jgi:tetratricopeptide (TPR) repeat protein
MDTLAACIAKCDRRDAEVNLLEQTARKTQSSRDFYMLAKIHRFRGDPDSAVDAYNRAALKDPKDYSLIKEYGLYLEQIGQAQKAEYQLRKAYAMKNTDEEVAAALRRVGVIPGPAIKDEKDLVGPPVPKGPIPPVTDWKLPNIGNGNASAPAPLPPAQPAAQTVQAPRD